MANKHDPGTIIRRFGANPQIGGDWSRLPGTCQSFCAAEILTQFLMAGWVLRALLPVSIDTWFFGLTFSCFAVISNVHDPT
jgi:hypothetical protein